MDSKRSEAQASYEQGWAFYHDPERGDEAEAALLRALELDPSHVQAHFVLGSLYAGRWAAEQAEPEFRKVIELDAQHVQAHYRLGRLLIGEDNDEASSLLRKAIALDPNYIPAYISLSDALTTGRMYEPSKAEAILRQAIGLDPVNINAQRKLAELLLAVHPARRSEAEVIYHKLIELAPFSTDDCFTLVDLLAAEPERLREAEAILRQWLTRNPDGAMGYFKLVDLLRQQGRERESLNSLQLWAAHEPENFILWLCLAAVHRKLNDPDQSRIYLQKARALIAPDDDYNLACLETIAGHVDAACNHLRRASQKNGFDRDWAKRDPDLEWLRDDPRFKEIVGE